MSKVEIALFTVGCDECRAVVVANVMAHRRARKSLEES